MKAVFSRERLHRWRPLAVIATLILLSGLFTNAACGIRFGQQDDDDFFNFDDDDADDDDFINIDDDDFDF